MTKDEDFNPGELITEPNNGEWITVKEAARRSGFNPGSIRKLKSEGNIQTIPIRDSDKLYMVNAQSLEQYLQDNPKRRKPRRPRKKED